MVALCFTYDVTKQVQYLELSKTSSAWFVTLHVFNDHPEQHTPGPVGLQFAECHRQRSCKRVDVVSVQNRGRSIDHVPNSVTNCARFGRRVIDL